MSWFPENNYLSNKSLREQWKLRRNYALAYALGSMTAGGLTVAHEAEKGLRFDVPAIIGAAAYLATTGRGAINLAEAEILDAKIKQDDKYS